MNCQNSFSKNSFTQADYMLAKEAYQKWEGKKYESVDEYILRKRKIELNNLVNTVIENELSDEDKLIVKLHWYDGLSTTKIAAIIGADRTTIFRRLEKINSIIYEKLKYAIEYRYGRDYSRQAKIIIKNADGLHCFISPQEIGERLRDLRARQCLSQAEVGALTGILPERISELEKCGSKMTAAELKRISKLFQTTSDYIIFGKQ